MSQQCQEIFTSRHQCTRPDIKNTVPCWRLHHSHKCHRCCGLWCWILHKHARYVSLITDFWLIIYVLISGLQSFCIYASIGLACIFFLQVSWLVAWLVLDERRIRSCQNGFLPCIVHVKENPENNNVLKEEEEEKEKSVKVAKIAFIFKQMKERIVESNLSEVMKNVLRRCISSLYFTLLVLALSAGLLAVGVFGLTQIKYKFDPLILVPSGRVQILTTIFQLQIISFSFWIMLTAYLNNSFRQLLHKISWG